MSRALATPAAERQPRRAQLAAETAAALEHSIATGQPVVTKLILRTIAVALHDEQTVADLLRRSLLGENAFADLVRAAIADEAELIAAVAAGFAREVA